MSGRGRASVLALNGAAILLSTAAAVGSTGVRPTAAEAGFGRSTRFWTVASGIRTASIAVPVAASLAAGRPSRGLLVAAGLVQLGDGALGVRSRTWPLVAGSAVQAALHLGTALRLRG